MSGKVGAGGERGDEELIDSLYGERTEKSAASDGDDDLELSQLRRLRGMFAELKEDQEEPPAQGMALLMAAARQAAEERKAASAPEKAGLWARLRAGWQAMVAHPGMAAAAAAVVVVGASGYLMSRGVKTAESTYTSDSAVRATAPAAAGSSSGGLPEQAPAADPSVLADPASAASPEPVTIDQPRGAGGEGLGRGGAAPSGNTSSAGDDGSDLQMRRPARNKAVVTAPQTAPATGGGGAAAAAPVDRLEERADESRRDFAKQADSSAPREEPVKKPAPSAPSASAGPSAPPAPAPAPPPPPPPPTVAAEEDRAGSSESVSVSDEDEDEDSVETKPRKVESVSNQVERWFSLAREAAAKKDCNAVRELGKRIEAENRSFYESKFRKDAAIAKCL